MRKPHIDGIALRGLVLASALGAATLPGRAQQQSAPPDAPQPQASPTASTPAPSTQDKSKAKPTPKTDQPAASDSGTLPPKPTDSVNGAQDAAKKPSTAADNPFPEDISEKAAADAKAEAKAAAASAPTPSVSGSRDSSSRDNTDQLGLDDPARKQLKLQSPDGSADVYDPKRAAEDVKVGKFYMQTGYFKGAYDRFKDATIFDHENAEAVFWLAEAARKLNLEQEAAQNYALYLAAVPDGPTAKAARKALAEIPVKP